MASGTFTVQEIQTTDTEFRDWVTDWSDALDATGYSPVTSDTGQINLATVAKPAASNTAQGYQIRYLNDSMHATTPIYYKLEFGSGSAATSPSIWVTIGTGSDGSGSITGTLLSRTQYNANAANTSVQTCYYSGWDGGFAIWGGLNTSTGPGFLVIFDRTVNPSTGAPTGDGAWMGFIHTATTLSLNAHRYRANAATLSAMTGGPFTPPGGSNADASWTDGTDVLYLPGQAFFNGEGMMYFSGAVGVLPADFPNAATFTATIPGGTASVRALTGSSRNVAFAHADNASRGSMAIRN